MGRGGVLPWCTSYWRRGGGEARGGVGSASGRRGALACGGLIPINVPPHAGLRKHNCASEGPSDAETLTLTPIPLGRSIGSARAQSSRGKGRRRSLNGGGRWKEKGAGSSGTPGVLLRPAVLLLCRLLHGHVLVACLKPLQQRARRPRVLHAERHCPRYAAGLSCCRICRKRDPIPGAHAVTIEA